jgi:hypothetical protein
MLYPWHGIVALMTLMKQFMNRLLFLALLCCYSLGTGAQEVPLLPRIHVNFGPKVGVNLSKLDGESWEGGYKTNLLGGVFVNVHKNRFGIQVEGLFSQTTYVTGTDFNSVYHGYIAAGKDSVKNGQFKISYFNIPVLLQVKALNRAWLQLGVQYSGLVSVEDKDAFLKDAEGLFKKGTVAGVIGLQVDVTRRINAGGRYILGLSDINLSNVSENWKQRDVQFHIGLTF